MMYGNYYGMGFQPSYFPAGGAMPDNLAQLRNQQMQAQPAPQCGNGIIWVLGEAEAKGYPVAPGNTVILWDKDNPTIFVKSADASGIPSLRILDWNGLVADILQIGRERGHAVSYCRIVHTFFG